MNTSTPSGTFSKSILLCAAATLGLAAFAAAEPSVQPQADSITVFLIDDQTGEELAAKHGIQPLAVGDTEVLINAVLRGSTPVRLLHEAVDEDSSDNAVAEMNFRPYEAGQPPKAPSSGLPISQLAKAMKDYRKVRSEWQRGIIAYRNGIVAEIERFIKGVTVTQLEVSERFDKMLAARNGRDFNRSDILTCVTTADQMLGKSGRRFLVLNTDCKDMPAGRAPRKTALTATELDPAIELIFVNTSRIPEQSPMFRDIRNPVHHADTMRAAMEIVVAGLGGAHESENGAQTASVTESSRRHAFQVSNHTNQSHAKPDTIPIRNRPESAARRIAKHAGTESCSKDGPQ